IDRGWRGIHTTNVRLLNLRTLVLLVFLRVYRTRGWGGAEHRSKHLQAPLNGIGKSGSVTQERTEIAVKHRAILGVRSSEDWVLGLVGSERAETLTPGLSLVALLERIQPLAQRIEDAVAGPRCGNKRTMLPEQLQRG